METTTFKERVTEFWERFEQEEKAIRKVMDEKQGTPEVLEPFQELFALVFDGIAFNVGINDDLKYELILSPEGDPMQYYMTWYFCKQAPESLSSKWNFYPYKPAMPEPGVDIRMFDTRITADDLTVYVGTEPGRKDIDLEIYAPKLSGLDDNQKYGMFFIFLDLYIGELYTMNYIRYVDFVEEPKDEKPVPLATLKNYMEDFMAENNLQLGDGPNMSFSVYEIEVEEPKVLREDIYIGNTANTAWINDYYNGETERVDAAEAQGVVWGFVYYDNSEIEQDELITFRGQLEDLYDEILEEHGMGMHVGSATGGTNSYLDFVIFDLPSFLALTNEIAEKYDLKYCGFSPFKKEGEGVVFTD